MSAADIVASVTLIAGAATSLVAGIAVLRFPDTQSRVHAATKPQLLGIVLLMVGLGIRLGTVAVVGELVLIVVLQMLTAPVAAHLAIREAHRLRGRASKGGDPGGNPDGDLRGEPGGDPGGNDGSGAEPDAPSGRGAGPAG